MSKLTLRNKPQQKQPGQLSGPISTWIGRYVVNVHGCVSFHSENCFYMEDGFSQFQSHITTD